MRILLPLLLLSSLSFGQIVNIPDLEFKAILVGNPAINTNGDLEIQITEANSFTGLIDCSGTAPIIDLTGIEYFTQAQGALLYGLFQNADLSQNISFELLHISSPLLLNIDLSQNVQLKELQILAPINALNLNQNTLLENVHLYDHSLQGINLSYNLELTRLRVGNSPNITTLDLSNNSLLTYLNIYNSQLSELNLSQNPQLESAFLEDNSLLGCLNLKSSGFSLVDLDVSGCSALNCIEVDDPSFANANWTLTGGYIDNNHYFSTDCNNACSGSLGIEELTTQKELIKVVDLLGREVQPEPNKVLIYIYSDGTSEKVFKVE